jgi:elongation factor Ts
MSITASQVKDLREKTGAGMMDAKNALAEAGGDMEKAVELLRQNGMATAEKKSGRVAAEGQVASLIPADAKSGILVEVNCETDFVAKGDEFLKMVQEVAQQILEKQPADVDALLAQQSIHAAGATMQGYITDKIAQLKENISVRRFVRYDLNGAGRVHAYIHTGGKIGVLVEVTAGKDATAQSPEFQQLLKDLAMQIASAAPEFVSRTEIPQSVIDEETRVEMGKEDLASKPEEIRKKIVAGRVDKLLAQKVLLEQPFVKDPGKTITDLLGEQSKQLGDTLTVTRFTRFVLGEGIEKKVSNFAEEVLAAQRV